MGISDTRSTLGDVNITPSDENETPDDINNQSDNRDNPLGDAKKTSDATSSITVASSETAGDNNKMTKGDMAPVESDIQGEQGYGAISQEDNSAHGDRHVQGESIANNASQVSLKMTGFIVSSESLSAAKDLFVANNYSAAVSLCEDLLPFCVNKRLMSEVRYHC